MDTHFSKPPTNQRRLTERNTCDDAPRQKKNAKKMEADHEMKRSDPKS